ncbi:hypothetical protein [uncultured Pedobacter sp.]|uniref:hypothetical protein n=1 Tax=uncultured Pedobacter sp. TaxID=246139 RepID=UPI0025E3E526|nr:hypothetical protein [uncultured Pedobacter sp.]
MPQIPPITDAYIDEIIKAPDAYNPTLNKTQGVKLRELIKLMRDRSGENDYSGIWENKIWRPYQSVAEALANLPVEMRFLGMTIFVLDNGNLKEFWFNHGVTNAHFLEKSLVNPVAAYDVQKTYQKDDLVWVEENGARVLYQSNINNNLNNPLKPEESVLVSSGLLDESAPASTYWQQGWYFDSGNNWTPDHTTDFSWYTFGPWQTRVLQIDSPALPADFSAGVGKSSTKYIASYQSGNPSDYHFVGDMPADQGVTLDVKVFDENGILLFHCKPQKMFYYLAFKIVVKLGDQIYTVSIPQNSTDFTVYPLKWKKIGYDKIDTDLFLDITVKSQTKAGNLTITGIGQFEHQTNSKRLRVLYEVEPRSIRDTQNGYIEERTFQVPIINEGKLNDYRILGYFYSEGYFDNSLDIVLTSYTGLARKYVLFNSEGRGEGAGSGFLGTPSTWFKLLPDIDGGNYGGADIQLEALWHYPHGWYIRAKVVSVTDAENGGGDGGVYGFAMYVKTYQGTFIRIFSNDNDDIVMTPLGIPNRGNDPEPTTLSFGTAKFAQILKVYKTPTDEFDVVRLKDLNGNGSNPSNGDYIQASPVEAQNASINITGDLKVGQTFTAAQATFKDGPSVLSTISDANGYTGLSFDAKDGPQVQLRYQPNALGHGLVIYNPGNPNNTGLGNSDWRRILVDGDAIEVNPSSSQNANIDIKGSIVSGSLKTGQILSEGNNGSESTLSGNEWKLPGGAEGYIRLDDSHVVFGKGSGEGFRFDQNSGNITRRSDNKNVVFGGDDIDTEMVTARRFRILSDIDPSDESFIASPHLGGTVKIGRISTFGYTTQSGIAGLKFSPEDGVEVQIRRQPGLGHGLFIYDPESPLNTNPDVEEFHRILVAGDAISVNPLTPQNANIDLLGSIITRNPGIQHHYSKMSYESFEVIDADSDSITGLYFGTSGSLNFNNYFHITEALSGKEILQLGGYGNGNGNSAFSQRLLISEAKIDNAAGSARTTLDVRGVITADGIEITDPTKGIILAAPNGTRWRITVSDSGALSTVAI